MVRPDAEDAHGTRDAEQFAAISKELLALRSSKGGFRPARLVDLPTLYELARQASAVDTWRWILANTKQLRVSNQFVDVAFASVFGKGENVTARLTDAGNKYDRDQRTARDWSDRGIPVLAQALVDATYLFGNRAMHYVEFIWAKSPDKSTGDYALAVLWQGDEYLRGEQVEVYLTDADIDPDLDDSTALGTLIQRVEPEWHPLDPPRGSFRIRAVMQFLIPHPTTFNYQMLTFRMGRQFTQMVRIANLPRNVEYGVAVTTFRQGVSFWFTPTGEPQVVRGLGEPIALR